MSQQYLSVEDSIASARKSNRSSRCRPRAGSAPESVGLRYPRPVGGKRMETQNDSRNTAVLALNASVGMEPTVGFWTFVRP